jgi:hypothetical protein
MKEPTKDLTVLRWTFDFFKKKKKKKKEPRLYITIGYLIFQYGVFYYYYYYLG